MDVNSKQTKDFLEQLLKEQYKDLELQDLLSLQENINNPMILSVLMFKLIDERKKTNKILEEISEKYDRLQFQLKNKPQEEIKEYNILSETDDQIITHIRKEGKTDAQTVKVLFGYKGTNAASQRLNKLVKEKYLQKIQSGRKVYFVVR
jgi:hypothetical protein